MDAIYATYATVVDKFVSSSVSMVDMISEKIDKVISAMNPPMPDTSGSEGTYDANGNVNLFMMQTSYFEFANALRREHPSKYTALALLAGGTTVHAPAAPASDGGADNNAALVRALAGEPWRLKSAAALLGPRGAMLVTAP